MKVLADHDGKANWENLMGPDYAKKIAKDIFATAWGWYMWFGQFNSGWLGFYYIFAFIKAILTMITKGYGIKQAAGCT